jgi:ubiquitin C-terminal hydrolase
MVLSNGTRQQVDWKLNKKLNKFFDLSQVIRLEAEFLMSADFHPLHRPFRELVYQQDNSEQHQQQQQTNAVYAKKIELETCIQNFARPELLDGANRWYCEQCKAKTEAVKYTYLTREPENLILHLRRFKVEGGQRTKLSHIVKFPLGKLNFTKTFHQGSGFRNYNPKDIQKYALHCVVQHQGSAEGGGHYVTYCKDVSTKDWYLYDDSKVSKVLRDRKKDEIVNSNSYLLFYRKKDKKG